MLGAPDLDAGSQLGSHIIPINQLNPTFCIGDYCIVLLEIRHLQLSATYNFHEKFTLKHALLKYHKHILSRFVYVVVMAYGIVYV